MNGHTLSLAVRRALKAAAAELGDMPWFVVVAVADRRGVGGVAVDAWRCAPKFEDDDAQARAFVEAVFCAAARAADEARTAKAAQRARVFPRRALPKGGER